MAVVSVTCSVTDSSTAQALENVSIRIYSLDGTSFITSGSTDSAGEVVLSIEEGEKWIRLYKIGYSFSTFLKLNAEEGAVFDITGTNLVSYPPSTDTSLCRVTGYVVGAGGAASSNATVEFKMTPYASIVNNRTVVRSKVIVYSNTAGKISVDLIRDQVYDVVLEGYDDQVFQIKIPDAPSSDFTECLFPKAGTLSMASTLNVTQQQSAEFSLGLTLKSNLSVPYSMHPEDVKINPEYYIKVGTKSDELSISFSGDTLKVLASKQGTFTFSLEHNTSNVERRLPETSDIFKTITVIST